MLKVIQQYCCQRTRTLLKFIMVAAVAGFSIAAFAQGDSANTLTVFQPPAEIDQAWQKAGAKYDAARVLGAEKIGSVELLGSDAKIGFEAREDGLHIQLPETSPGKYAYAFRIGMH